MVSQVRKKVRAIYRREIDTQNIIMTTGDPSQHPCPGETQTGGGMPQWYHHRRRVNGIGNKRVLPWNPLKSMRACDNLHIPTEEPHSRTT